MYEFPKYERWLVSHDLPPIGALTGFTTSFELIPQSFRNALAL